MKDYKIKPTKEYRYFLNDPNGDGIVFYCNKNERDKKAASIIDSFLDEDGWNEEVEFICIGEVTKIATKTNLKIRPPEEEIGEDGEDGDGEYWGDDFIEKCNYEMVEI